MSRDRPTSSSAQGPRTWNPVVPLRHAAMTLRRAAVSALCLGAVLLLVGFFPGLAVLRPIGGWVAAAAFALFAGTLLWAVVSNGRLHRRS